jgi:hypothetical protein
VRNLTWHALDQGNTSGAAGAPFIRFILEKGDGKMRDGQAETVFRRACGWLALVVLAAGLTFANAANHYDKAPERVIAIGDVHGDFDDFCLVLRKVGLADSQNHWIGGKTILVQAGDVIDRGNKGREAMDLLIRLEKEAEAAGGEVVSLMGNHEVMNILGDLRYVSAETYAEFADGESEKRREVAYQDYAAWYTSHAESLKAMQQTALPTTKEEWMAKHPAGFLEYREALDPAGVYGKWVRQHAAVAKIGGVVFLHGGLSPNLVSLRLEQITSQVRAEVEEFDKTKRYLVSHNVILPFFTLQETAAAVQTQIIADRAAETPPDAEGQSMMSRLAGIGHWLCMRDDGPLWFRGYDEWSEEEGTQQTEKILAEYEATHIVVGHTVQKTAHIRCRFGGRVFLIDTGMLSTYWRGGRASALEILAGRTFNGVYLDGQERIWGEKPIESTGKEK